MLSPSCKFPRSGGSSFPSSVVKISELATYENRDSCYRRVQADSMDYALPSETFEPKLYQKMMSC